MKLVTYVQNMRELGVAKENGVEEAILSPKLLSRFGELSLEECGKLADEARALGIKPVLEWDLLATENDFEKILKRWDQIAFEKYGAVRTQDPGAFEIILERTDKKIQLVAETGNHNLEGLKAWEERGGNRLERIVLSIELTRDKLEVYKTKLKTPLEFLVLGRILLFYTPRNLLTALLPDHDERKKQAVLNAVGESEESPHKGFPVLENSRGTFMFHIKHQFLMEHLNELKFLDWIRVDLRFDSDFELLESIKKTLDGRMSGKEFKQIYPFEVIKGFYKVNKSDVLFKKLKNSRIQRQDENYLGEVLETKKGSHQALILRGEHSIKKGMELLFITPEGKELRAPVVELRDTAFNDIEEASAGGLALMNYVGGVWTKSQVYLGTS